MRKDMAKQITECYRINSKDKYRNIRGKMKKLDFDDTPRKQGMRKPHSVFRGWDLKEFGENLRPLFNFLDKQVGRPWDNVYSEICEHIKLDSAIQLHIIQHVFWHVETNTWLGEDGKVYTVGWKDPYCLSEPDSYSWRTRQLYVHPENGLLCRTPKLKRKKKKKEINKYTLKDNTILQKVDGIWYRYFVKELPKPYWVKYSKEQIEAHPAWRGNGYWLHPIPSDCIYVDETDFNIRNISVYEHREKRWYAYHKKQLSKKELKKYDLHNTLSDN